MPFASKVAFVGGAATLPPQPVTPPLNLTGAAEDGSVFLQWVPSPSPNTTAVRVYRDDQLVATLGPKVTSYRDDDLTNFQSYRYTLEAVRNGVVSKRTDTLTLTPSSLDLDLEPPTNFRVAKRDGGVRFFYTPSTTVGVEGIYVYQDGVIVTTAAGDSTTTAVYGLTNGQAYVFRLAAYKDGGVSLQTEAETVVPGAERLEIDPPKVSGTAGDGKVTLTWTRSTTPGVQGYEVFLFNQFMVDVGTATTVTLDDLTNGEHYTCRVLAYKDGDRSLTTDINTYEAYPRAQGPAPDPLEDMSPYGLKCLDVGDWKTSLFTGDRLTFARTLDGYLAKLNDTLPSILAGNKAWSGSIKTWPSNCYNSRGEKVRFGAYNVLRIGMSGVSNRLFYSAMLSKHPGYVDASYKLLDRAISQLLNKGSERNYDENDGWLGWRYGTENNAYYKIKDDGTNSVGKYPRLENSLNNGVAQHPYILWINRDTRTAGGYSKEQKLKLMNQGRAYFKLHHTPRWIDANRRTTPGSPYPTRDQPTLCRQNFPHATLSQAEADVVFAQLETDMYVNNYRSTVTVDMPDGFSNQKLSLEPGTSADVRTHPYYQRAVWTFESFNTPYGLRTAYGDDIRNSDMRRWYGNCGATYWGQRTIKGRNSQFTANSGYNGLTFAAITYLFLGGVIRDSFGSTADAIRFMQGCAGGASHMLPERLRTKNYQYCFVMDDPKNKDESNAYLFDGQKKRPFGGSATETTTTSSNRETANNWDNDPVGIFAAWDPSGRLGQVNIEVRGKVDSPSERPGTTIARMLESLGKEHNPEWSKRY